MTQSGGLDLFYNLHHCLCDNNDFDNVGFYATDSRFYKKFINETSDFLTEGFEIIKEWEIVKEASTINVNHSKLREYEKGIGYPVLWNALLADRRITWGKMFAFEQDYKSRFSHDEMLAILQTALQKIEQMFDYILPDLVVSFQCNTIGEYLSFLFARSRDIPILNLRPTRIKNYIYAGEDILEPSKNLENTYRELLQNGMPKTLEKEVSEYLENFRFSHAMYEGVVAPSDKPPKSRSRIKGILAPVYFLATVFYGVREELRYRYDDMKYDNSVAGFIKPFISRQLIRPMRARKVNNLFKKIYVWGDQLEKLNYAFFPLHPEPEVTVIVYSKPYLNQIEAIRLISHNLPVGMKIIVKEHPWHVGKRTVGYYRKLLDIPNVMLASPEMGSRDLVKNAALVTTISGSIGLEGLIMKIPVVVLGRAPFKFLPRSIIRHASNLDRLGFTIRDLLENYNDTEEAIRAYVGAVIRESVPVDFYSRLLRRKEAFNPELLDNKHEEDSERIKQFKLLADYIVERYILYKDQSIYSFDYRI